MRPLDCLYAIALTGLLVLGVWLALHQEPPLTEDMRWPQYPSRLHCWGPVCPGGRR